MKPFARPRTLFTSLSLLVFAAFTVSAQTAVTNNPFWRGETQGSYSLVFNAILTFDQLNAGRKLAEQ